MYPSQQNATDQTSNFFWLLILVVIIVLLVWFFAKSYVLWVLFHLRYGELYLMSVISKIYNPVMSFLHLPTWNTDELYRLESFVRDTPYHQVNFAQLRFVSDYVGRWYRYPFAGILVYLAFRLYFKKSSARFTHHYNMPQLKKEAVKNWPQIKPVSAKNLVNQDLETGAWSMAQLPLDFCKQHDLLAIAESLGKKVWTLRNRNAEDLFVLQIGPYWPGLTKLPIHIQALAVMFIAKATREHEICNRLIAQLASSANQSHLDFTDVQEQAKIYQNHKLIKWLERRHAYTYTLMASLLEIARTDGVLASAEILWLKTIDRRLWYTLNSVGRQTAVVEVAGPYAHWKAEKKLKRAVYTPMVKQAVIALEREISNTLYVENEEQWHTSSAA